MKKFINAVDKVEDQMIQGMVKAYPQYVRKLDCISDWMSDAECGCPYPGAKEAYILDLTDTRRAIEVIRALWECLPFPK